MRFVPVEIPGSQAWAVGLAAMAVGLEWARVLAARVPDLQVVTLLAGGTALCLLGVGRRPAELGLGRTRLPERLVGGLALAGILLLPAAMWIVWLWNRKRLQRAREAGELEEGLTFENIPIRTVERLDLS